MVNFMTQKEFFEKVVAFEGIDEEIKKFATEKLEKINGRAKTQKASKEAEYEKISAEIMAVLTNEPQKVTVIAEQTGYSSQKLTPILKRMALDGIIIKGEVRSDNRIVAGYSLMKVAESE